MGPSSDERKTLVKRLRGLRWDLVILSAVAVVFPAFYAVDGEKGSKAVDVAWRYLQEMAFIFPAVLLLMGLFAVWVRRETVVRFLGEGSGLPGMLLSVLLGMLPTGPLYVAFPLAAMLLHKGARAANVILFLSSWACIKLPMELVEIQFLGWKFALLRWGFTVSVLLPMAWAAERLMSPSREKAEEGGEGASG